MMGAKKTCHHCRGFSLTELAIVLGLVGMVLAAVWVAADTVWRNYQIYKTTEQVVTVAQNIREYYGPIGKLPGAADADIDLVPIVDNPPTLALIPAELRKSGGGLLHALNGDMLLVSNPTGLPANTLRIVLQGLKQKDCSLLLMQMPVLMGEVGARRLSTSASHTVTIDLGNISDPGGGITLPLSMDAATTWCDQSGTGNEVRLDVKLRN